MKPLNLDFCQRKPSASFIGLALLIAGLLCSAYALRVYSHHGEQITKLKTELARLHSQQHKGYAAAGSKELEPALQQASTVIDRLSFPWDKLLTELEASVAGQDVALLSIQPDISGNVVVLHAEARNMNAMLKYIRQLNKETIFTGVHLASHKILQDSPQKPVRFTLSCTWAAVQTVP